MHHSQADRKKCMQFQKPLGPSLALASYKANPPPAAEPSTECPRFFSGSSKPKHAHPPTPYSNFFACMFKFSSRAIHRASPIFIRFKKMHACITHKPLASHCRSLALSQPFASRRSSSRSLAACLVARSRSRSLRSLSLSLARSLTHRRILLL